jgi:hypothetical protein
VAPNWQPLVTAGALARLIILEEVARVEKMLAAARAAVLGAEARKKAKA